MNDLDDEIVLHLIVYPESGHAPQHQYPELAAAQIALFQQLALPE